MTKRVFNFAAGPATLPEAVLRKAAEEMLNYKNSGMSVMELSHRSALYQDIIDTAEADFRKLVGISDEYSVLFLQGGASTQFPMIPMNLMVGSKKADYVNTGAWSKKAIKEAKRYGDIKVIASSEDKNFSYIPEIKMSELRTDADYFHVTSNNTIYGTKLMDFPRIKNVPLIGDMSSNIMSESFEMNDYSMIYGGAQKNIGPAGVTFVVIKKDLLGKADVPTMLNYKTHADKGSMFNTPPTYGIYIAKLVFEHMLGMGGVAYYEKYNNEKATLIYDAIDSSKLFNAHVALSKDRSLMNIPFFTDANKYSNAEELNKKFLAEAAENNMVNLKGHRSIGGMRASVYNAMTMEGCKTLANFICDFDKKNS